MVDAANHIGSDYGEQALDPAEAIEEARDLVYLWGAAFFIYGFWIVWVVGVNGPIFSEIVPPKYRSYQLSLCICIVSETDKKTD